MNHEYQNKNILIEHLLFYHTQLFIIMLPNQNTNYENFDIISNTKLGDIKHIISGYSFGEFWGILNEFKSQAWYEIKMLIPLCE